MACKKFAAITVYELLCCGRAAFRRVMVISCDQLEIICFVIYLEAFPVKQVNPGKVWIHIGLAPGCGRIIQGRGQSYLNNNWGLRAVMFGSLLHNLLQKCRSQ